MPEALAFGLAKKPYAISFENEPGINRQDGDPACTFVVRDEQHWQKLIHSDAYQLARAFIHSDFEVEGDVVAAIKLFRTDFCSKSMPAWTSMVAMLGQELRRHLRPGSSERDIQFHYDRSNEFYRCFLDSRMVYSCAYFRTPDTPLEEAQLAKLDHICRKLRLRSGQRFLDIGCGWGALVVRSADHYGTFSNGCTLSNRQLAWAREQIDRLALAERVSVEKCDYRDLSGTFDRIASVGMVEHVGRGNLETYFAAAFRLLADDGLFLNHGIARPSAVHMDTETALLTRQVFPGSELVPVGDMIACAERAGFEVLDAENLRPHYALTCKAWVDRLVRNRAECLKHVDSQTYRTWLLYLAASSVSFDKGDTEIHQLLLSKRGAQRALTRDYMYVDEMADGATIPLAS